MENIEDIIIQMKKDGKTLEDACDYVARSIGYDDTVSYCDIVDIVEKVWDKIDPCEDMK